MSKRSTRLLLEDILLSIDKIMLYTQNLSFEAFIQDDKTIDAVIRNFEIIGEAAHRLPDDIKEQYTTVDWYRLRGFRNRIVHDYMGIDYTIVWSIKEDFLLILSNEIKAILKGIV